MDTSVDRGPWLKPGPESDTGAPPARRRFASHGRSHSRWLVAAPVTLALLALVVAGDWGLRTREMAQLMRAVERSESSMVEASDTMGERVALWNAQSASGTQQPTQSAVDALDSLRRTTASAEAAMLVSEFRLGRILVMPWHWSMRAAQRDYRAHVEAWREHYAAMTEDLVEHNRSEPGISETFEVAETSMRGAVPAFDPFGLGARVERTFDR